MTSTVREREDKFEVDASYTVPDTSDVVPEGGLLGSETVHLVSEYYDTADHDLLRRRITLRRRSGDADTGWHLKVPAGVARNEIRTPLTSDDIVPAELSDLVVAVTGRKPLAPVASLTTVRHLHRMIDADGTLIAEIADDEVSALAYADTRRRQWREIEIELGAAGDEKMLSKLGKRVRRAGAQVSRSASKLERALNSHDELPVEPDVDAVQKYMREQFTMIITGDISLRQGEHPIHATRVAIRRLRSTLRVFSTLFDAAAAESFDAELSWYAGVLGEVRDREVQRARFADAIAALPPELVIGPVAETVDKKLSVEQSHYREEVTRTLSSDRYLALIAEIGAWVDNPHLIDPATPAKTVVKLARTAADTARKRLSAAGVVGTADEVLHRARKAAKRARYAAELTTPVVGEKQAMRSIKPYKQVQEVLGEHQDSAVAAAVLKVLADNIEGDISGFTLGVLYANELHAAQAARDEAQELLR